MFGRLGEGEVMTSNASCEPLQPFRFLDRCAVCTYVWIEIIVVYGTYAMYTVQGVWKHSLVISTGD